MTIRARTGGDRARARGLEPLGAVALGEAQDAEARAIALLGVRAIGEDRLYQLLGGGSDAPGPVDDPRWGPRQVLLMRLRHVRCDRRVAAALAAARVRRHALAAQEHLDGGPGEAQLHLLVDERVRHRVEVAIELDVVVEVHARGLPLGVHEALGRQ